MDLCFISATSVFVSHKNHRQVNHLERSSSILKAEVMLLLSLLLLSFMMSNCVCCHAGNLCLKSRPLMSSTFRWSWEERELPRLLPLCRAVNERVSPALNKRVIMIVFAVGWWLHWRFRRTGSGTGLLSEWFLYKLRQPTRETAE